MFGYFVFWRPDVQPKEDKNNVITVAGQSYLDTEAGFLLDEDDLLEKNKPVLWNKIYSFDLHFFG